MNDRLSPLGVAHAREKCLLLAGRLGVVAAVFSFIAGYIYGIVTYGPVLGIALGWLPCGAIAWLIAIAVAAVAAPVIRWVSLVVERLPFLLRQLRSNTQHRH